MLCWSAVNEVLQVSQNQVRLARENLGGSRFPCGPMQQTSGIKETCALLHQRVSTRTSSLQ